MNLREKRRNKNIEKIAERLAEIFVAQIELRKNKDKNAHEKRK